MHKRRQNLLSKYIEQYWQFHTIMATHFLSKCNILFSKCQSQISFLPSHLISVLHKLDIDAHNKFKIQLALKSNFPALLFLAAILLGLNQLLTPLYQQYTSTFLPVLFCLDNYCRYLLTANKLLNLPFLTINLIIYQCDIKSDAKSLS